MEKAPDNLVKTPWEWFDFAERARVLRGTGHWRDVPSLGEEGWKRVWGVEVDGRVVPFKVFRRATADGAARPILMMAHGMGLTIASFRGVTPYLLPTHDLVLPDYTSFSLGAAGGEGPGMKIYTRSLWQIADALGIERLRLAGNSLGGGLCLMAAIDQPGRVEKMVLSNPAWFPQQLPQMYRIARVPLVGDLFMALTPAEKFIGGVEYIGYHDKGKFDPELKRRYVASLSAMANRHRLMRVMRQLPADARDATVAGHVWRLSEIRAKVLLTWGEHDPLLAAGAGERLARALPDVVFEPQADLSHMPHEEAPDRVGRRWAEFLNGGMENRE